VEGLKNSGRSDLPEFFRATAANSFTPQKCGFSATMRHMEEKIRRAIERVLEEVGAPGVTPSVERPSDLTHGDYATNVALVAAKMLGKNPRELADELAPKIKEALGGKVECAEVAGPGFINLTLSRDALTLLIAEADAQGEDWGKGNAQKGKRVMIEYSNPNAFKEMHLGHLIGTVVGESVSRLIENQNASLARDTFGGDVGPNVAKALWALKKSGVDPVSASDIGFAYAQGARAYEEDEAAKKEIDVINQAIYARDPALASLWEKGREISMAAFRELWKRLGTHFDFEFFDSDTVESGMRLVRDGLARGVFKESDGAIIYDGEAKGVHTMVFITSHSTPTYEAKDIGLAFLREERWPSDEVIIITGNEQNGRFKTVFAALAELAPAIAAKTNQVGTGFLRLSSGKMSSREGSVITAEEFLRSVIEKANEKNDDPLIAEQVAVGAIKFMILRQSPGQDIIFDPEKSLSLQGDSGPYLQYALVRAAKILTYSSEDAGGAEEPDEPYAIERRIIHYPEVAARAARELAPNLLTTYLTELAATWNAFYASEQVLGSKEEAYKMRVTRAFANTMANGLWLLGIPAPEKM